MQTLDSNDFDKQVLGGKLQQIKKSLQIWNRLKEQVPTGFMNILCVFSELLVVGLCQHLF